MSLSKVGLAIVTNDHNGLQSELDHYFEQVSSALRIWPAPDSATQREKLIVAVKKVAVPLIVDSAIILPYYLLAAQVSGIRGLTLKKIVTRNLFGSLTFSSAVKITAAYWLYCGSLYGLAALKGSEKFFIPASLLTGILMGKRSIDLWTGPNSPEGMAFALPAALLALISGLGSALFTFEGLLVLKDHKL